MVDTPRGLMCQKDIILRFKLFKSLYDRIYSESMNLPPNEAITPITPFGKRVHYTVYEFEEFMDSSNMTVDD